MWGVVKDFLSCIIVVLIIVINFSGKMRRLFKRRDSDPNPQLESVSNLSGNHEGTFDYPSLLPQNDNNSKTSKCSYILLHILIKKKIKINFFSQ